MLLNRLPLHMLPPRAVLLAADIVLVFLPEGDRAKAGLLATLTPPFGTVDVSGEGGRMQVAAARIPSHALEADQIAIALGDASSDEFVRPVVLGSDIRVLADELDTASQWRLLGFLLGFCLKAFDLGQVAAFAASCRRLAETCDQRKATASVVATVSPAWTVLNDVTVPLAGSAFVVGHGQIRRSAVLPVSGYAAVRLLERAQPGDLVITLGEPELVVTLGGSAATRPDLIQPHPDLVGLRGACLGALAPVSKPVAARIREQALFAPAAPITHDDPRRPIGAALEAALPDGEGHLFLRGWLRDPLRLVSGVELQTQCGSRVVDAADLHRFPRPDIDQQLAPTDGAGQLTGFVSLVRDPSAGLQPQPELLLHLHSGSRLVLRPPLRMPTAAAARAAVLGSVPLPHVTEPMFERCLSPAIGAFHDQACNEPGHPERIPIGSPPPNPATSIIVPLYRNLAFLRFQMAAFAADPELRTTELLYVLDSPEQRAEAEHLLRGLYGLHAMPVTLVVMPSNRGYAAANNAAAAFARAPELLLLNSDVVPARPGWLAPLRAALQAPEVGAVGPKLLFDDGSLQHAGLFFERDLDGIWFNAHYDKGLPRSWPSANRSRAVPGVTGAAILVHRDLFERVGGICADYVIGDYEDSDFCLRLRDASRVVHYEPAAELFHFERKSIGLHAGYSGTLASHYNRRLHHARWDPAISALMALPIHRPGLS